MYNSNESIPNGMTLGRAERLAELCKCGEELITCDECEELFCASWTCGECTFMNGDTFEMLTEMGACSHYCAMKIWTRTKARAEGRKI